MINPDELIFVVDDDNNPLPAATRLEVHENGYWHRVAHIWIVDSAGLVLCQKRSIYKDHSPGMMEAFFGGHQESGIEAEESAVREFSEELGINVNSSDLNYFGAFRSELEREFQSIFVYFWDGKLADLILEEEEVESVDLYKMDELDDIFRRHDEDWVLQGNELEVLDFIKNLMRKHEES